MDSRGARTNRAQHLRPFFESCANAAVLAMAADGRDRMGPSGLARSRCDAWHLCNWVDPRAAEHLLDKPLRPLRFATGLPLPAREGVQAVEVRDPGTIPAGTSPALPWLASYVLGDTDDDRCASCVCGRHDLLHPDCDSVRGKGSGSQSRRGISTVPQRSADDHSGTHRKETDRVESGERLTCLHQIVGLSVLSQ